MILKVKLFFSVKPNYKIFLHFMWAFIVFNSLFEQIYTNFVDKFVLNDY